ncbi:MAG: hypothetical protein ONB05_12330 [candidate division KSB1 bacterium]|nr:hypothetical protein [candidate division KSB1 bacterium]
MSEEVAHKGKVLFTADGGDSLYIKILENGVETWLLVMPAIVSVGDTIEFPSSVPMLDFQSKTMNTTFDKIYLPPWIRVVERGDKSSEEKYLYYVEQSLSMNNYYPTIGEINKAIEVNPNKAAYYAKRADLLLLVLNTFRYVKSANEQTLENNRKLCISALNDLDKAISLNPKDDSFYAKKAEALNGSYFCKYNDIDEVTKNDIDEVIKLYSSAININPGKADYHVKIGMAYKRKKEWGKVQEHAKKAISLDGKNKDAYYLYGSFYEENSNYNMALKYYAKGLGLNDFIVFSDPDIDRVMEKTKKYDDAIKIYSDLIKQHPDRIRNFIYGRAKYYVLAKNYKKAVADYTTLIKLEPDSEYNYFLRANSYYLDDKYEKALNDYRTACEMNHAYACNMVPVVEADLRRGTNWKIAASSSTVNFYYDKKGLTRNKNGVAITWVREEITNREQYIKDNEIEDYEKDKFQNVSYIMSRFEVDCPNQKLKVPISVTYAENGNVISSFENDKAQSINVIPNSIGSAIYEKMCKETPAKKAVKK